MDEEIENLLEKDGWCVVCESPLELEHSSGSVATGYGAEIIIDYYKSKNKRRAK